MTPDVARSRVRFEDLTPFLAGDKVKAYPNLANIPSGAWKSSVHEETLNPTTTRRILVLTDPMTGLAPAIFWTMAAGYAAAALGAMMPPPRACERY